MINVKDQIYTALKTVTSNVTDLYPADWSHLPAIQYTEEANNVTVKTDLAEQLAYLRYKIDIWDRGSTSVTAVAVDNAIAPLGLTRINCYDNPVDDASAYRHKIMEYEGTIDVNTEQMYWENAQ